MSVSEGYYLEKTKTKVSFDFDSTLSEDDVEQFAKRLVNAGCEVWIVTSRLGFGREPNPHWNDDLHETAKRVGIPAEQIHFCNMSNKSEFLKDKNFLFHLDDDSYELNEIREETNVFPVLKDVRNDTWLTTCNDLIRIFGNK